MYKFFRTDFPAARTNNVTFSEAKFRKIYDISKQFPEFSQNCNVKEFVFQIFREKLGQRETELDVFRKIAVTNIEDTMVL